MHCKCFFEKLFFFLVYMYNTHPSYRTSIVGKNCAHYIRIFTVVNFDVWSEIIYLLQIFGFCHVYVIDVYLFYCEIIQQTSKAAYKWMHINDEYLSPICPQSPVNTPCVQKMELPLKAQMWIGNWIHMMGQKARLFFRVDNFVMVSDRKTCSLSKVSLFLQK